MPRIHGWPLRAIGAASFRRAFPPPGRHRQRPLIADERSPVWEPALSLWRPTDSGHGSSGGRRMQRVLVSVVVLWMLVGGFAAFQRGDFPDGNCSTAAGTALAVATGP